MGAPRRPGGARFAAARADDAVVAAYEAYRHEVFSFLARTTGDAGKAQEHLQVVFQRLAREARDGRFPGDVHAWLLCAASSLAMGGFHGRSAIERALERFGQGHDGPRGPSREPPAVGRERVAELERALRGLAEDERLVLLLASRGLSGPEMAEATGRTEAATRATLCRARMRVLAELDGYVGLDAPDRFLEVAAASLDVELSPGEQANLDEHLAGCESCRDAAPQLRAQARLLASLPPRSLSDRDADAILARVLRGGFHVPPVRLMGATAVLVLVALVTFSVGADLLRRAHYPVTQAEPAIAAPSAVVGAGGPPAEDVFLTP